MTRPSLRDADLCALVLGEVAARGFGFLAMTWLFRRLEPAQYGFVETTVAVLMFCQIAVELGLGTLGTRDVARAPAAAADLVRRVATIQLAVAAALLAALAAAALLLPLDPDLRVLLVGFGAALLAVPFALHWVFQARGRMVAVAAPKALRYAVFAGGALLLVRGPGDLARLPLAEVAGAAAMSAAYVAMFRRGDRLRIGGRGALDGALVREALPICGSTLVWAVRMYFAVVWVGAAAGPASAGSFGAALRIVLVLLGLLDVYFVNLFPRLSVAAATSPRELRELTVRSLHVVGWPSLGVAAVVWWASPWIMRTVYGAEHTGPETAALLAALSVLVPVIALRAHARFALISLGKQRWELGYSLVGVAALVALLVPLTARYGAAGAAWAMAASEAAATALGWAVLAPALRSRAPVYRDGAGGGAPRREED